MNNYAKINQTKTLPLPTGHDKDRSGGEKIII